MSHIPHRKEKDCLNCGTIVQGPFCHHCGQENLVPKETFWHMVTHFFYDITHFDSSFFHTAYLLLFKPGFLSKQYMQGKRATYLHPIRMYVFTSAFFFLMFFTFFMGKNSFSIGEPPTINGSSRLKTIAKLEEKYKNDTTKKSQLALLQLLKDTTKPLTTEDLHMLGNNSDFTILNLSGDGNKYKSIAAYDSVQHTLPEKKKDSWFTQRLIRKEIALNEKYGAEPSKAFDKLGDKVLHRLPYMLFVSLPLFAFILRLVYIRRKQFYFADHGVFTIHLYVFTFLLLLIIFLLNKIQDSTNWGFIGLFIAILVFLNFVYLYKAMRNFYGQGRFKTFIKFIFVFFSSVIMMAVLFVFFLFFSAVSL